MTTPAKSALGTPDNLETPDRTPDKLETPDKPRRARSAYAFFCDEQRGAAMEDVKARDAGKLQLAELGKELSRRWAEAKPETRRRFQLLADQDRHRHSRAMRDYVEATDPIAAHKARSAHLMPKRPLSAYFMFVQDKVQRERAEASLRAEGARVTAITMGAQLGRMWHEADEELRAAFTGPAQKAAAEYAERRKEWRSTSDFSRLEDLKKSEREAKKRKAAEVEGGAADGPSRPPRVPRKAPARPVTTLDIDMAVLTEAQLLGLEAPLLALANRKEVREEGICARTSDGARKLLAALKQTRGSVDLDALLAMSSGAM